MTGDRGLTLTELMVTISIISILVIALGFQFVGWSGRYRVESQVKEIEADLMNARVRAMQRNRVHFVDFPSTKSYRLREDTNGNNANDDAALPTFPKTAEYTMSAFVENTATSTMTAATLTSAVVSVDARGIMSSAELNVGTATPARRGVIRLTSTVNPDYDCIIIEQTRVKIGLTNTDSGVCDAK